MKRSTAAIQQVKACRGNARCIDGDEEMDMDVRVRRYCKCRFIYILFTPTQDVPVPALMETSATVSEIIRPSPSGSVSVAGTHARKEPVGGLSEIPSAL